VRRPPLQHRDEPPGAAFAEFSARFGRRYSLRFRSTRRGNAANVQTTRQTPADANCLHGRTAIAPCSQLSARPRPRPAATLFGKPPHASRLGPVYTGGEPRPGPDRYKLGPALHTSGPAFAGGTRVRHRCDPSGDPGWSTSYDDIPQPTSVVMGKNLSPPAEAAQAAFESAWSVLLSKCTEADFLEYRRHRASDAWTRALVGCGLCRRRQPTAGRAPFAAQRSGSRTRTNISTPRTLRMGV
jgi:hypothetical protein